MRNLEKQPWDELDRRHKQAQEGVITALILKKDDLYRRLEESERRYRMEKVRRARERVSIH